MSDPFVLTPAERNSSLWVKILRFCEQERDDTRARNDAPHDAAKTATLRGQIDVYKRFIGFDQPPTE